MNFNLYFCIGMEYTYEWYTIPKPYELPSRITWLMTEINSGDGTRRKQAEQELNPILQSIGITVLDHVYNISSKIVTGNRKTGELIYGTFMCISRHLCTCFTTVGNYISAEDSSTTGDLKAIGIIPFTMYFSDIKLTTTENNTYVIHHVNTYKMNIGNIPGFMFRWYPSETIGIRISDIKKIKFPLFGISNKKLFIPEHSYFIEGSHQELYGYPFHFFNSEQEFINDLPNENYKTNAIWNATCRTK